MSPIFESSSDASQAVGSDGVFGIESACAPVVGGDLIGSFFFVADFGHVAIEDGAPDGVEESQDLVE